MIHFALVQLSKKHTEIFYREFIKYQKSHEKTLSTEQLSSISDIIKNRTKQSKTNKTN